jgi:hypothetical protein
MNEAFLRLVAALSTYDSKPDSSTDSHRRWTQLLQDIKGEGFGLAPRAGTGSKAAAETSHDRFIREESAFTRFLKTQISRGTHMQVAASYDQTLRLYLTRGQCAAMTGKPKEQNLQYKGSGDLGAPGASPNLRP